MEELGEELSMDFTEEEADTVNGYLISRLGHLPSEEETEYLPVTEQGYRFEIERVKGKMVDLVRVTKIEEEQSEE